MPKQEKSFDEKFNEELSELLFNIFAYNASYGRSCVDCYSKYFEENKKRYLPRFKQLLKKYEQSKIRKT